MSEATAVPPVVGPYLKTLARNLGVIQRNTEGLSHQQSLLTVRPGGSHLNWLLGHLISSRDGMLRALDSETVWGPEARERYGRGSTPATPAEAQPFEELLSALERSQGLLTTALEQVSSEQLQAQSGDRTVGQWLEFLVWHETYHVGQTALYRSLAGLAGTLG